MYLLSSHICLQDIFSEITKRPLQKLEMRELDIKRNINPKYKDISAPTLLKRKDIADHYILTQMC